jgi:hypothetical protein
MKGPGAGCRAAGASRPGLVFVDLLGSPVAWLRLAATLVNLGVRKKIYNNISMT